MRISFLLLFLCESTGVSLLYVTTSWPISDTSQDTNTTTVEEELSALQLIAKPDYPVAAGQSVHLHCMALTMPRNVSWSWQRWKNQTWQKVGNGRDLTLTEPDQSGQYCCFAKSNSTFQRASPGHKVYIVSTHATVGEKLGIAAFVLSLLAFIINLAVLSWLGWQRFSDKLNTSNTAAKCFPGSQKAPKECLPQTGGDGDVYMNYTSTNQAYTDLDPTKITGDNVYASLS